MGSWRGMGRLGVEWRGVWFAWAGGRDELAAGGTGGLGCFSTCLRLTLAEDNHYYYFLGFPLAMILTVLTVLL